MDKMHNTAHNRTTEVLHPQHFLFQGKYYEHSVIKFHVEDTEPHGFMPFLDA